MQRGRVYEVTIRIDFTQDGANCCCNMIRFAKQKNVVVECLNPGAKDLHFVRFGDGNIITTLSKHKSCPFCSLSSSLPIHIERCYILPNHSLVTLFCTKDVLAKLYDRLDSMKVSYRILSLSEVNASSKAGRKRNYKMTQNQRIALITAFNLGYFDTPQKTHIREIAKMLGKSPATVHELLKRGIRNILARQEVI